MACFVVCKRTCNDGDDVLPHPCHGLVSSRARVVGTDEGNDGIFIKRNARWHRNEHNERRSRHADGTKGGASSVFQCPARTRSKSLDTRTPFSSGRDVEGRYVVA